MIFTFFCFLILFVLAIFTATKLDNGQNHGHMINADWLDNTEKFKLVSRWGIKG